MNSLCSCFSRYIDHFLIDIGNESKRETSCREGRTAEGAIDYAAMLEAMMTSIMRRMPAPGPSVDVGVQVQATKSVDFAKLCKDYTALGGKVFLGTESTIEVQR